VKIVHTPATVFAYDDMCFVAYWREGASGHLDRWEEVQRAFLKNAGPRVLAVAVVPSSHPGASRADREAMATITNHVFDHGGIQAVVLQGTGFRASLHRSVTTTVSLFIRNGNSLVVADDFDTMVKKLPADLAAKKDQIHKLWVAADEARSAGTEAGSPA
jgi:hypothetical protein